MIIFCVEGWSTAPDGDIALLGKLTGNLEINIMVEDLSNLLSKSLT